MKQIKNVLLLFGGISTEHTVSCRSSVTIYKGLVNLGYNVSVVGISLDGEWIPYLANIEDILYDNWVEIAKAALENADFPRVEAKDITSPKAFFTYKAGGVEPDLVYIGMHGINSEDGAIQGFLELAGVPYIGAPILSSALCMDKIYTKLVLNNTDIPQLDFVVANRKDIAENINKLMDKIESRLAYPVFIKPSNGGSSVGTFKAKDRNDLENKLNEAIVYDQKLLIEPFYAAREIEVACLGNLNARTALPGEIVKSKDVEYYDYETKYITDSASLAMPAKIKPETVEKLQSYARKVYKILEVQGLARIDFFVSEDEREIYFNEINNLPGFTSISLFPQAWQSAGMTLEEILQEICELALERFEMNKRKIDLS